MSLPVFAEPLWFLLTPLIAALAWRAARRTGTPDFAPLGLRLPSSAGLNTVAPTPRHWPRAVETLALLLLLFSLARPQLPGAWLLPPADGRDIVLLVDASPSMAIRDFERDGKPVARIDVLKEVIGRFLDNRPQDRFSLVVVTNRAATLVAPTTDHALLRQQLQRLHPGLGGNETALGEGLALAIRNATPEGDARDTPRPLLIVFSDGENTGGAMSPREALALARERGLALYTVLLGPATAATTPRPDASNEPDLSDLSHHTHGEAFRGDAPDTLDGIMRTIDRREASVAPPPSERQSLELYPLPLGFAVLLLAFLRLRSAWSERA